MCGITGIVGTEDKTLLQDMAKTIQHRGPDGYGYHHDTNISLGHRRLSIIDLKGGKQPLYNEDGTICVIHNGEIYNYKALREDLEQRGHKFTTHSDSETIVHAYEAYGDQFIHKLDGMFAFALWDSSQKKLILARDRFGKKPLFYTFHKGILYFASEMKALLVNPELPKELNYRALHSILTFRGNTYPESIIKHIYKLPAGHLLVYSLHEKPRIYSYWKPYTTKKLPISFQDASKKTLALLSEAVEKRLMSDVPLGVYLSGGVDSGAVVGLMKQHLDTPIRTFSVGFGFEEEYDEVNQARFLSEHFGTHHKEIIVTDTAYTHLPKVIWHYDEPISDPTGIPVYLLSQQAKKDVTVILTGEGGDEQFGGYFQFKMIDLHKKFISPLPKSLRQLISFGVAHAPSTLLNTLFKYASHLGEKGIERCKQFILTNNPAEMYLSILSVFDEQEKKQLLTEETKNKILLNLSKELTHQYHLNNAFSLDSVIRMDIDKILKDDILMKLDKNTMAHGIEGRTPFLDTNLTLFNNQLPTHYKVNGFKDKILLRHAVKNILPKQTSKRKKSYFFVPVNHWFKTEFGEITKQLVSEKKLKETGLFKHEYINTIFKNYSKSEVYYARQLWSLATFMIWNEIFMNENKTFNINTMI